MRKQIIAMGMLIAVAGAMPQAQDANLKDALRKVGNGLGILRGLQEDDSLMTVEYWATGTMREVGPKIGPQVQLKNYYAAIAYDFPGMRLDITRTDGGAPPREIQVVSGKFAWNEIDKIGGGFPEWGSAVPAMDRVTDRLVRLWMTPYGVYKAAVAAGEKTKLTMEGGKVVLNFPLVNSLKPAQTANLVVGELEGAPVKVTLNAESRPERVELRYRDRVITTTFSDYGDLNEKDYKADIFFPARILQTVDGQTVLDLTIQKTNTYNPYVIMPVPESVEKGASK